MDSKNLSDVLNWFAQYVVDSSKNNLTAYKKGGGDLYNSIKYTYEKSEDMFLLDFLMEDYGPFVDKGVKGLTSTYPETASALSKFQYGSGTGPKNGLRDGIKKWVAEKRFQFRDKKTGRFITRKSLSFIIANSIYSKGIRATMFFTKPFEAAFPLFEDDILEGFLEDNLKLD